MSDPAESIARRLLQIKAIRLSPQKPFTWASGLKSPIYCDNRLLLSYPDLRTEVAEAMAARARALGPIDVIAGVATAGIPMGAILAHLLELPFVYVRSKPKEHGRQNQIEGAIKGTERVLVIEDLISTGGSSIQAAKALEAEGCTVVAVMAIFNYEFPETEITFAAAGFPAVTLTNYPVLVKEAAQGGWIDAQSLDSLNEWRKSPASWSSGQAV